MRQGRKRDGQGGWRRGREARDEWTSVGSKEGKRSEEGEESEREGKRSEGGKRSGGGEERPETRGPDVGSEEERVEVTWAVEKVKDFIKYNHNYVFFFSLFLAVVKSGTQEEVAEWRGLG